MLINNVIPFSNCDGPGNRLVIFVQGCNLNCLYCHNFETINYCNNCLACIETCEAGALSSADGKVVYDEDKCVECDTCIYTCPNNATPKAKEYSSKQISDMIISYADFIDGVTFSGGECTLYHQELLEIVENLKPYGINVLLDTNAYFDYDTVLDLLMAVDGVMVDIKTLNNQEALIGNSKTNLDTLDKLIAIDKVVELRTVDLHDQESALTIKYIDDLIAKYPKIRRKINPLSTASMHKNRLANLNAYRDSHK